MTNKSSYYINQDYENHLNEWKQKSICEKLFRIAWGFLSMSYYKVYFYYTDKDKYDKYIGGINYIGRLHNKLMNEQNKNQGHFLPM